MNHLVNDHLNDTRNQLLNEIVLLNNEQFNKQSDAKSWSIAQVCHHLYLVEKATMKAVAWGLKEMDRSQKERKNLHLLLDRTKKIAAPQIVEPSVEPFTVQQITDLLSDSRIKLNNYLNTVEDKSILAEKTVNHPALGALPLDQWIDVIYLHEQRHTEQIKEIKSQLGLN